MGCLATVLKFAALTAALALSLSAAAYFTLHHTIQIDNVTCFGLFSNNKIFVEMQQQKEVAYVFGASELVYQRRTQYQFVEVYRHPYFGHILVIDGSLQITQRDEVNYHEMTAHVPLAYLPAARRALIIGGGDGGALLRVLQHKHLTRVDLVDIDMAVMRSVAQRFFPELSSGFLDARTRLFGYDGNVWVAEQLEALEARREAAAAAGNSDDSGNRKAVDGAGADGDIDFIIIDSTDYGSSETLFTNAFYAKLKRLMSPTSVMVVNLDSPSWNPDIVAAVQRQLGEHFRFSFLYQAHQPTFLSGHYSFLFLSDTVHPMRTAIDWGAWHSQGINTYYYNPDIHYGAFLVPEGIRRQLSMSASLRDVPAGGFYSGPQRQDPRIAVTVSPHRVGGGSLDDEL